MHAYEIRILSGKKASSLIIEASHPNDAEAIRWANSLSEGRGIEVWRDLDCIHCQLGRSAAQLAA